MANFATKTQLVRLGLAVLCSKYGWRTLFDVRDSTRLLRKCVSLLRGHRAVLEFDSAKDELTKASG